MEARQNKNYYQYNELLQADIDVLSQWIAQKDPSEETSMVPISTVAVRKLLAEHIKPYVVYNSEADIANNSTPIPNYGFCLNWSNQLHIDLVKSVILQIRREVEINDLENALALPSYGDTDTQLLEEIWALNSNTEDIPPAESLIESPQPNDILNEINQELEDAISKEESTLSGTHIGGNKLYDIQKYSTYLVDINKILSMKSPIDRNKKTFDVYQIFEPKYWQDVKNTLDLSESTTHKISFKELLLIKQYIVLLIIELQKDLAQVIRKTAIRSLTLKDIQQELKDAHDTNLRLASSLSDILLSHLGDDEYLLEYFPEINAALIYIIKNCNYNILNFKPEPCISRGHCTSDEMMQMIQILRFFTIN